MILKTRRWLVLTAIAIMLLWSCGAFFDFGELFLQLHGRTLLERGSITASEWQCFLSRAGRPEQQYTFNKVHRELQQATRHGVEPARVIFSEKTLAIVNPYTRYPSQSLEPITVVRSEHDLPAEVLANGMSTLVHSEKEFSSGIENGWIWTVRRQAELPLNAKVFLNEPSMMLYCFGTFMWYPRRVDVDTQGAEIRDSDTFDAAFNSELAKLDDSEEKLRALGYTHLIRRNDGELQVIILSTAGGSDLK